MKSTKTFHELQHTEFFTQLRHELETDVSFQTKEYILNVDEDECKNHLVDKYTLEELKILEDSEIIQEPLILRGKNITDTDIYTFQIAYSFTGDDRIFKLRPGTYRNVYVESYIDKLNKEISYYFRVKGSDARDYDDVKKSEYSKVFDNLKEANVEVHRWNIGVKKLVDELFKIQKDKFLKENEFFESIKVNIDKNTKAIFEVPVVQRKIIPQPIISDNKKNSDSSKILTLDKKVYEDIINILNIVGKSMERKPSLYIGKDEEALRDVFLLFLETRYESVTATGETFNRGGKTDILLRNASDGTNLFVAECKVWRGKSVFIEAIDQLFDRYLTWRDSKTALLLFVPTIAFSKIIEDVKNEAKLHKYYLRESGNHGDSSLSYIFHLASDKDKEIFLEIILFHFDKQ